MAKVKWLPHAKSDIKRLHAFLKEKNPKAASAAIEAIRVSARKLAFFPEVGRPMDDDTGRRELLAAVGQGGYVLRYLLEGDDVVIIRVWHAKERR